MAGKRKLATVIDDDGCTTDGMYRWGGTRKKHSADEIEKLLDAMADNYQRPAVDRVLNIRKWLIDVITPYVDGPHDDNDILAGKLSGWFHCLTLNSGKGLYRIADDLRHTFVEDAIDALNENHALEQQLAKGGNIDEIVRLAIQQGLYCERIKARAWYAPTVLGKAVQKRKQGDAQRKRAALKDPEHCKAVFSFIRGQVKLGISQRGAATEAAALLAAGTLPGLPGIQITIGPKTLENLYSRRNEKPSR